MPPRKSRATDPPSKSAQSGGSAPAANMSTKRKVHVGAEVSLPKRGKVTQEAAAATATATTAVREPAASKPATNGVVKPAPKSTDAKAPESKPRTDAKRKATTEPKARPTKKRAVINEPPTERVHVFVFGGGDNGELGLGPEKRAMNVKRPRLNHLLAANTVGVVQVATGGMHAAALTYDNQIYTWGVNDQGACGRDTTWHGVSRDINASSDDSDDDDDASPLNPKESTPAPIDRSYFPKGTKFVQVAAGDSMTFALTDEGLVYGWGTFRSNEGILGFTSDILVQRTPMLIPELSKVASLSCGANHVLALTTDGNVFAWGSGQQNQLGRRVVERTRLAGLTPREFGLPRKAIKYVACGAYHSFAIDTKDNVWAWGLNSYGECGISDNAGLDDAVVPKPQKVASLAGRRLAMIDGGSHHSIAVTQDGECLVWGRADGAQTGLKVASLPPADLIHDERGRPRILKEPTRVPGFFATFAAAESDHCIAIDTLGRAWSWGFSATFQTGQGTDDDVELATVIDNTAVRGRRLNWAGAGGQYSMLTGIAEDIHAADRDGDVGMVNGI